MAIDNSNFKRKTIDELLAEFRKEKKELKKSQNG
tara:strand:+ start:454 stop:555 length:102 start_codon:yes stop_codon:yes gene_type:complete